VITIDAVAIEIQRIGDSRVRIGFTDSGTRKYWDGKVGFSVYMEAKKAIIEERAAESSADAVVFLARERYYEKMPPEMLDKPGEGAPHFFYLQHRPQRRPMIRPTGRGKRIESLQRDQAH
jgi:hypothetical protein